MLTAAISLRLFVTIALNAHLIPILVWRGVSEVSAAYFVSLFAFGPIIATLGMGWLGDRWPKSLFCSLGIMPTIVAMLGLTLSQSTPFIYCLPFSLAITMGIAPLNWALIGDLFGRRSYATLRQIMAIADLLQLQNNSLLLQVDRRICKGLGTTDGSLNKPHHSSRIVGGTATPTD